MGAGLSLKTKGHWKAVKFKVDLESVASISLEAERETMSHIHVGNFTQLQRISNE